MQKASCKMGLASKCSIFSECVNDEYLTVAADSPMVGAATEPQSMSEGANGRCSVRLGSRIP